MSIFVEFILVFVTINLIWCRKKEKLPSGEPITYAYFVSAIIYLVLSYLMIDDLFITMEYNELLNQYINSVNEDSQRNPNYLARIYYVEDRMRTMLVQCLAKLTSTMIILGWMAWANLRKIQ